MSVNVAFGKRDNKETVETGTAFAPKFGKDGLIPTVTQDASSGEILMVAYMNEESLRQTLSQKEAVYYSRSRNNLWHKGSTSGHIQKVIEMRTDCDQDVILLKVEQVGPGCCHAGYASCFYRKIPIGEELEESAEEGIAQLDACEEQTYDPEQVY